jgi:hypothetical protein
MPSFFTRSIALIAVAALPALVLPAKASTQDRIRYDNQCYMIDGKDTFFYSGSFHYFRCPKELWAERFEKIKASGMNCVETYVAWNWHERQPPTDVDDFSKVDMTDLSDWLDMAINRFGLYVVLRPGPYICAEWDGGGYPQWLITKRPADAKLPWLRGDDPTYLAWCRHWYAAVAKAAVPFQITHRPAGEPGVILWQIENEYNYAAIPVQIKLHQLQALAHDSRDFGIDVPLITCMTDDPVFRQDKYLLQNVVECRNTYPRFNPSSETRDLIRLADYQPEKPRFVTELQGGWFSDVGNQLSDQMGYTAAQLRHVTLQAWAYGFTGTNYYMMFGGTNQGDWGAAMKTTSYDYAAPIREWGGVGPRYFAVQGMANFLRDHAMQLVRSVSEDAPLNGTVPAELSVLARRAADGSHFLFVFNNRQSEPAEGDLHFASTDPAGLKLEVHYQLDPYDAKVFYLPAGAADASQGQWLPEPVSPPQRPTDLPTAITISDVRSQIDPGPPGDSWQDLPPGANVEDLGIFDRRFIFYRANLPASAIGAASVLFADLPEQDSFVGQLNSIRLDISRHGRRFVGGALPKNVPSDLSAQVNAHWLVLLYENGGRSNGGIEMDDHCGLVGLTLAAGTRYPQTLRNWMRQIETGDPAADVARALDNSRWTSIELGARRTPVPPGQAAVYRSYFDLTGEDMKSGERTLVFGQLGADARVYVNGQLLAPKGDGNRQFSITSAMHSGTNIVLVSIKAGDAPAGIGGTVEIDPDAYGDFKPIQWQISGQSTGLAGKWYDPAFDDSAWEKQPLGVANAAADPPAPVNLVWYRLHFGLPAPDPHVWVPWKLHLSAAGNGFIYLNGHLLGRWWEIGPQQDFYLPECWLNFGPGATNVVALCLRPTTGATAVHDASVSPYSDFAETR